MKAISLSSLVVLGFVMAMPALMGADGGCGAAVPIGYDDGGVSSGAASGSGASGLGSGSSGAAVPDSGGGQTGAAGGSAPTCVPDECGPMTLEQKICDGVDVGLQKRCVNVSSSGDRKCAWRWDDCPVKPDAGASDAPQTACVVSGCSGELCVPAGSNVGSICIWKDEFACYRNAICESDAKGACGFRQTPELLACLAGSSDAGTGPSCGGKQCGPKEYCAVTSCGGTDKGTCTVRPQACPENIALVCGCDGKTYNNECDAASAGVSVASDGACNPTGTVCGGLAGTRCAADQFCNLVNCGTGDQGGTCLARPDVCPEIYQTVCGCDGKTYSSSCSANLVGVSVAKTGSCTIQ